MVPCVLRISWGFRDAILMRNSEFFASSCRIHTVLKQVVVILAASLIAHCHAINQNVVVASQLM